MGCTQKTQTEEGKENKESKRLSKNKNVDIRKNYEFISMLGNGNFGKVRLYRDRKQKEETKTMEKLLGILEEIKPGFEFTGRTDLVECGDLDSFDVISLVSELNDAYDIDIPVEDIIPENFNSVDAMMALINKHLED